MNTPQYPDSSDVLEDLANDVLVQIDKGAFQNFSRSVGNMVEFYAFLARTYVNSDSGRSLAGFAAMRNGHNMFHSLSRIWKRQYHQICDRASIKLEHEPEFFLETARMPIHLIDRTAGAVSEETLNGFCDFGLTPFSFGGKWWARHAIEQGMDLSVQNPGFLVGNKAVVYNETLDKFVKVWKELEFVPMALWERGESAPSSDKLWIMVGKATKFIRQYFRCTAVMAADAIWRGDTIAADVILDSFLERPRFFSGPNYSTNFLYSTFLKPDIVEEPEWENALKQIKCNTLISNEPKPRDIFELLVRNMWIDSTIILAVIVTSWGISQASCNDFILRILRKCLPQELDKDQNNDIFCSLKSSDVVLSSYLRLNFLSEHSCYRGWINQFVQEADMLSGPKISSGHIYKMETKQHLAELMQSFVAIIVLLDRSHNSKNMPTFLKKSLKALVQGKKESQSMQFMKEVLEESKNELESMSIPRWLTGLNDLSCSDSNADYLFHSKANVLDKMDKLVGLIDSEANNIY